LFGTEISGLFFSCTMEGESARVGGEIDLNTAPTLYEALSLHARDLGRLPIIDMSEVTYFDFTGVSALIQAERYHQHEAGKPTIIGVQPHVMRIMRLAGLDELFDICGTEELLPEP
jgi:anti-sigma B factor antagonist